MNSEELAMLCSALSIEEKGREAATLDSNLKTKGERLLSLCLVSKVITTKLVNKDALINVLSTIWRTKEGVEFEALGPTHPIKALKPIGTKETQNSKMDTVSKGLGPSRPAEPSTTQVFDMGQGSGLTIQEPKPTKAVEDPKVQQGESEKSGEGKLVSEKGFEQSSHEVCSNGNLDAIVSTISDEVRQGELQLSQGFVFGR
ncbi:hypothetical protein Q3G72_026357 [Acer saccharum]|nr:hypothetical protein Q3G72_026357 [Acer saccharum]